MAKAMLAFGVAAAFVGASGLTEFVVTVAFIWPTPCCCYWVNALNVSGVFIWRGCFDFFEVTPLDAVLLQVPCGNP